MHPSFLLPLTLLLACKPTPIGPVGDTPTDSTPPVVDSAVDSGSEHVPDYEDTAVEPPTLCHMALVCDQDVSSNAISACTFQLITGEGDRLYQDSARATLANTRWGDVQKPRFAVSLVEEQALIEIGATWKYLDNGIEPDPTWTTLGFDDSAWAEGPSPLGYGDEMATTVGYGDDSSNKYPVTWFRHSFSVETLEEGAALDLSLRRDDGGVVYLNGQEVFRSSMPEGDIDGSTYAAATASGSDETTYFGTTVAGSVLTVGENLVAVSIHQANGTSSDIAMDVSLSAPGAAQQVDFLGMGAAGDWLVDGTWYDRTLLKSKLAFDLFNNMGDGRWAPEVQLGDLSLDGAWQGIYLLSEAVQVGPERLDIQPADDGSSFMVYSGAAGGGLLDSTVGEGAWYLLYPDPTVATTQATGAVSDWLAGWQAAVTGADPGDPASGVFAWIDLDSAVDYVILQELSKNLLAYGEGVYLWKDVDGLAHLMPYEMELSFGFPCTENNHEGWNPRPAWVQAMLTSTDFQARLSERWQALRGGILYNSHLMDRLERYRTTLEDRATSNFELWPLASITYEVDGADGYCPFSAYEEEYTYLQEWLDQRLVWMDDNLAGFTTGGQR